MDLAIGINDGAPRTGPETNGAGLVPEVWRSPAGKDEIAGAAEGADSKTTQPLERGAVMDRLDALCDPVAVEDETGFAPSEAPLSRKSRSGCVGR